MNKYILLLLGLVLCAQSANSGIHRIRESDYYRIDRFDDGPNTCYVVSSRFASDGNGISCVVRPR